MNVVGFTPVSAAVGGALIGLSASALLFLNGQVAGISGIVGGLFSSREIGWRLAFLAGLALGGLGFVIVAPSVFEASSGGVAPLVIAGVHVGLGTRLGNGCTSGDGVCGIARRSPRSIVATMVFMAAAVATVFVTRHVLAGPR